MSEKSILLEYIVQKCRNSYKRLYNVLILCYHEDIIKEVMMYEINNDQLDDLSIFALRDLARRTGVSSPTSKKKSDLIQQIIDIREGRLAPVGRTKQGRPPKCYSYDRLREYGLVVDNSKSLVFHQETENYEYSNQETKVGFVEVFDDGTATVSMKDRLSVSYPLDESLAKKSSLRTGDKIMAELGDGPMATVVKDIYTINGEPITTIGSRASYYEIFHEDLNRMMNLNNEYEGLKISLGDNVYFYGSNNLVNTDTLIKLMNSAGGVNKIYVNTSLTEKTKSKPNELKNADKFIAGILDSREYQERVLRLAIEYIKRMFEMGNHVLVVIDDIMSIVSLGDEGVRIAKELLSLTKANSKYGSVTVLALMKRLETLTWSEKLMDKKFVIDDQGIHILY